MNIAILLALYNGERFLPALLESFCGQTRKDFSVYVHDDGSRDRSLEILHSFSDRLDIRILPDSAPGRGACRSFLWLLEQVDAEYFFFADQDDVWLPEKVERSLEALFALEQRCGKEVPVAVCCDLRVVDFDLKTIAESLWAREKIYPESLTTFSRLAGQNIAAGCTMCFNRALKAAALPLIDHPVMHDHYLILTAVANNGKLQVLADPLILYRQHEHNVVGTRQQATGPLAWVVQKLFHMKKVWHNNMAQYRQAKEIAPITFAAYWWSRIEYTVFIRYGRKNGARAAK